MIRKALWLLLLLCLLAAQAAAETITFCGVTADTADTYVDFGKNRVTDEKALMAFLDQMPCLTQVDMYASRLKNAQMSQLFDRYPQIFFGFTFKVGDHTVRSDATAFSTLHDRESKVHESHDFARLRYCKNLLALDIGHNWATDLDFLYDLPNLRVLILAANQVEDITPIASLKDLEYLELFTNDVTDLAPLAQLHQLRDLNIKNLPVKDLSPLFGMTGLERVWAGMKEKFPQEQKAQFEAALPEAEFDWESSPTGGTWREHPRYFVIREMFHTGVYIPFEEKEGE